MRRCQDSGLRFDGQGNSLDPDERERILGALGFRCDVMLDTFFPGILALTMNHADMEEQRIKRHMFLGRFGHQQVSQWAEVDANEVRAYAKALSELIAEERAAVEAAIEKANTKG